MLALYPDMRVEMDEAGNISLLAPGSLSSSGDSMEVTFQLAAWAKSNRSGKAYDASAIYNLPTGAKMSPDASWLPKSVLTSFEESTRYGNRAWL